MGDTVAKKKKVKITTKEKSEHDDRRLLTHIAVEAKKKDASQHKLASIYPRTKGSIPEL